jgi:eukaryotic-like serine/threonine-protein kinase
LRSEVESLIESHEQADDFIVNTAEDLAAEFLGRARTRLSPGQMLGHYTITALLGTGGMGEVYSARDEKLGRMIALKLLPIEFRNQEERVRRFELEARAASALNHPNIITIYEIGQSDSSHFIATEFIDGQTLRQHISGAGGRSDMDVTHVLDIGIQIASALAAAHSAGIMHRDIKPENIMLRADGFVKVLDFGLAKLALEQTAEIIEESAELSMVSTNPGVVMGTVRYMSPEQARGVDVDWRTDIWSLGVVLYELLTGQVPFQGKTPSQVIFAIFEKEPPALSRYSEIPGELERIVAKALSKNRQHRYQYARDLVLELKTLKRKLEAQQSKGSLPRLPRTQVTSANRQAASGQNSSAVSTVRLDLPLSVSSYDRVFIYKKAAALALTALLIAAGLGLYKLVQRNRSQVVPPHGFQASELVRLTATGNVRDAAVSLDGKYLAYVAESGGKESIWLRNVTTTGNLEIVPPADVQHYGETFSPDGAYVYYITKERNNTIGTLNRVSVLGGIPAKLIVDVDGPISFSPDGKQLAFIRGSSTGERALMLANADGSDERRLAARTGYQAFSFGGPGWSPDGKSIACGAAIPDPSGRLWNVVTVDVVDGSIKPLTNHKWKSIGRVWWLTEGNGMVFSATGLERTSTSQLWYLSYPGAEVQKITTDLQDYHGVSLTSDSKILISEQGQTMSSLWIAPDGEADRASKILSHKEDDAYFYYYRTRFSWTPSGQIIYSAIVNGIPSIWMMSAKGTNNRQLSSGPTENGFPSMTTDGRHIIFVSDRAGYMNVWRMESDGSNETQLTTGEDETWAWCSPDNRWIVYHSGQLGNRTLWRVPIEGGKQEQLTDYPSICPVVSPDGKWISCYYRQR